MTTATFRATIERTISPTPRAPRPRRPAGPSRARRMATTVTRNGLWIVPALALAWPHADLILIAFVLTVLAGATALSAVVDEVSIDLSAGADQRAELHLGALLFVTFLVGAADIGRLHWGDDLLRDARLAGVFVVGLGYILRTIVMGTNRFFARVVVVQIERRHVVCDVGPYEYVRHPGDLSSLVILLAIPVAIGSLVALVPALAAVVVVVRRTRLEDHFLHHHLAGYCAYARRVQWRLIPLLY